MIYLFNFIYHVIVENIAQDSLPMGRLYPIDDHKDHGKIGSHY